MISVSCLISILLVELVWDMFNQATGLLLLVLLGATLIAQHLCGIRSWCKYLCPQGRLIGQSARLSLVELRNNNNVCLSQCQLEDCLKEREECHHDASCLDLRYPWLGVLNRKPLSIAETLIAPLLIGSILAIRLPA